MPPEKRHDQVNADTVGVVGHPITNVYSLGARLDPAEVERLIRDDMDEEDHARWLRLLRSVDAERSRALVYADYELPDLVHVYITTSRRSPGAEKLFACAVVTEERLAIMLGKDLVEKDRRPVVEGLCLQVAWGWPDLCDEAIADAMVSWAGRCFGGPPVVFPVSRWTPDRGET